MKNVKKFVILAFILFVTAENADDDYQSSDFNDDYNFGNSTKPPVVDSTVS